MPNKQHKPFNLTLPITRLIGISLVIFTTTATVASQQQLQQLRRDISNVKQELGSDQQQRAQLQTELSRLEKDINHLSRTLRSLESKLKNQKKAQQDLLTETENLRQQLAQQRNNLSQQIKANYGSGQQQMLKLLLNQADPAETGRTMTYYGYFTRAQLKAVEATQLNIRQLKTVDEKLIKSTAKLESLQTEQQTRQTELKTQQARRKTVLASLNSEIQTKELKLQQLVNDEQALASVLQGLDQKPALAPSDFSDMGKLKGKLTWPTRGRLSHRFGQSRNQGQMKWQGVVIEGDTGQDVHVIAPGRVAFADWIRGYGLMLIVDHGSGYMSLYGQNQSLYKDVGDTVQANEVIAAVGDSGGNAGSGLYFEMRHKGKPQNPSDWCR